LDVVRDLREGAGAGLAGIERPRLCLADAEEYLVGEREIRELPASLRRQPIKRLEALLQFLGRRRYGQPAVAVPHDATQRGVGQSADQDRRVRPLHGARRGEDRIERVSLAAVADLAAGTDALEDLEIFVGDPAALLEFVAAENLE